MKYTVNTDDLSGVVTPDRTEALALNGLWWARIYYRGVCFRHENPFRTRRECDAFLARTEREGATI